jgi:glycosyltransferase involved in cell wall biosynthesis
MRAFMFLRGLAREHVVTLVAGSPAFPHTGNVDGLAGLVAEVILLDYHTLRDPHLLVRRLGARVGLRCGPSWDFGLPTPAMRKQLVRLQSRPFSLVHVFRLSVLPTALAALGTHPSSPIQLDLDEWESRTRLALSQLATGCEPSLAKRYQAEAVAIEEWERRWLPRMSRVFVCSQDDATALAARHRLHDVRAVGNAVEVPNAFPSPSTSAPPEILFIGSLGYMPNRDAVLFLLDEVLPALRTLAPTARLIVAGAGASSSLRARMAQPGVQWVGAPATVEPLYRRARIAVAPIRAGGGTRVKALEAFAQGCPLVATAAAIAGLDVTPGTHYLPAETAAEWAAAICTLLDHAGLRARLTAAAFSWIRAHSLAHRVDEIAALARTSA